MCWQLASIHGQIGDMLDILVGFRRGFDGIQKYTLHATFAMLPVQE